MREMTFKMERTGLLTEGEQVTLTEGVLPSSYYYTLDTEHDRSLAMSPNIPFTERLKKREGMEIKGTVLKIEENAKGFYVTVGIDEE